MCLCRHLTGGGPIATTEKKQNCKGKNIMKKKFFITNFTNTLKPILIFVYHRKVLTRAE